MEEKNKENSLGNNEENKEDKEDVSVNGMVGAWTGTIILSFIMISLFDIDTWWIWIPIIGSMSGSIQQTISYFQKKGRKCSYCGHELDSHSKFCKNCGKPMKIDRDAEFTKISENQIPEAEIIQYCSGCGMGLDKLMDECPTCGLKLH